MEKRCRDICGLRSVITAPHSTLAETRENWTQSPAWNDRLYAAFPVWLTGRTVAEQVAFQGPHAPLQPHSSANHFPMDSYYAYAKTQNSLGWSYMVCHTAASVIPIPPSMCLALPLWPLFCSLNKHIKYILVAALGFLCWKHCFPRICFSVFIQESTQILHLRKASAFPFRHSC